MKCLLLITQSPGASPRMELYEKSPNGHAAAGDTLGKRYNEARQTVAPDKPFRWALVTVALNEYRPD